MRTAINFLAGVICVTLITAFTAAASPNPCPTALPVPAELKLPAVMEPGEPIAFEKRVLRYLSTLQYRNLGWCVDVGLRDTGPFISNTSYGTHPSVRIYYSAEVRDWLLGGRQGPIKDGAVIIKEQYKPPAAAHQALGDNQPSGCSNDWTFMIRNSKASRDGWFWGEVYSPGMNFDNPFQYPNTGYGLYCVRCHASAEKEFTFSSLSNMAGAAGIDNIPWPISFRVDESWRVTGWKTAYEIPQQCNATSTMAEEPESLHGHNVLLAHLRPASKRLAVVQTSSGIQTFPPEPWDKKVAGPGDPPRYVTSDQCTSCHSGAAPPFGPNLLYDGKINVSQYGEWRWSPMGLAGRDPVFFAQLSSEFAYSPTKVAEITNTCLNCHGAMGLKSYYWDNGIDPNKVPPGSRIQYNADWPFLTNPASPQFAYGGLSRDGISCTVCHRIAAPANDTLDWFLANYINGAYTETKTGTVSGPFDDITQYPMGQALNLKPEQSKFLRSSRMCGVCHTINLPILDGAPFSTSVEQATYLEWLNSSFEDEYSPGPNAKSCQACHMPTNYVNHSLGANIADIAGKLANIQDVSFPQAEHLAAPKDITVRYRESIRRHEFLGLNGFMLQMFQQFADAQGNNKILGVRTADYMSGVNTDLPNAIANVVEQAQNGTAQVSAGLPRLENGRLVSEVEVTNLTGHRFPSGVGFRRAFLQFTVLQDGKPIFTSGGTNAKGEIVDSNGVVLPTEFFKGKQYQPHFDETHPIESSSQVQIYEELIQNRQGDFTTSFLQRDHILKDNRLLPVGWRKDGPAGVKIPPYFLNSTHPEGAAASDPVYLSGLGKSIVRYRVPVPAGVDLSHFSVTARLWYQSTPPYYFADRAQTKSAASTRLLYLANGLDLENTPFASWKLEVAKPSAAGGPTVTNR